MADLAAEVRRPAARHERLPAEPAAKMQKLGRGLRASPSPTTRPGRCIEYLPAKVPNPPKTAEELLDCAKANPGKVQYARPANSGPGRTFLMGLPYLLGDKDPKDPVNGWDKTWAYLKELNKYVDVLPVRHQRDDEEPGQRLGEHHRHAPPAGTSTRGCSARCRRRRGSARSRASTGSPTPTTRSCPKGVSADKLAAILTLMKYMLTPEQQAKAYDKGYFYPGPAVKDVTAVDGAGREPEGDPATSAARSTTQLIAEQPDGGAAGREGAGRRVRPVGPRGRRRKVKQVSWRVDGRLRQLRLEGVTRALRRPRPRSTDLDLTIERRRVHRPARPVRLRQVDRAELPGRAAAADRRAASGRTTGASTRCRRSSAASAWCSRTTRSSRTCPCASNIALRAADARGCRKAEIRRRTDEAIAAGAARGARRQAARPALRRPAAAGRDRPRRRARAVAGAHGRAAVQPGRQAAAGDAHRDPAAAPVARPHHRLRDARPGGGAVAGRPAGRAARRAGPADRHARGAAHPTRRTGTSPTSWATATCCRCR